MSFDSLRNSLSIDFRILMAALRLAFCWLFALAVPENCFSKMKTHSAVQVNCLAWAGLCENKTLNLKYMETLFKSEKMGFYNAFDLFMRLKANRHSLFVHLIWNQYIQSFVQDGGRENQNEARENRAKEKRKNGKRI